MAEIGVRELKTRASEIVRQLRERQARYTITYRGQPVGVLLPLDEPPAQLPEGADNAWDTLVQLGEEIGRTWTSPQTSAEILSDMRR